MSVIESPIAAATRGLKLGPPASWMDAGAFVRPEVLPAQIVDDGIGWWLIDDAIDLTGPEHVYYSRMVKEVTGSDGAGTAAAFDVTFAPDYEHVVIHHVRVIRAGKTREAANLAAFEILRRERDLERASYDGRLTAHLIIPDVRVGDIVDVCHSVVGASPVYQGFHGDSHRLQWVVSVDRVRVRMRASADRHFDMRYWGQAPAYEERKLPGGVLEREWLAEGFAPFRYERDTPGWWFGHAKFLVAERMSWSDVAAIYALGYEGADELPAELEAMVADIEASCATPASRAAAALRLVQRELRYLAISIGQGGWVPRPVVAVWQARAGDCKDASRLLTAVLRRLSIDAAPTLVNTEIGFDLGDTPPNLISFNHCICRVRIDGRTYWLDATGAEQGGRLDVLFQARHGYALPLVEDAQLEWMGEHEVVTICDCDQEWTFGERVSAPTALKVVTTYRSWRADDVRRWLRNDGDEAAAKQYRDYYEREFGEVSIAAPMQVEDRFDDNELVIEEHYSFARPFRLQDGRARYESEDDVVGPHLTAPDNMRRTQPQDVGLPRRVRTARTFRLPCDHPMTASVTRKDGPRMSGHSIFADVDKRTFRTETQLTVETRTVPPEDAEAFAEFAREMRTINGVNFSLPVHGDRFGEPPYTILKHPWFWIAGVVLLAYLARACANAG